ncbi:MAG: Fe-S assembly protein IscX [Planctomycetaceae bacterium]|nr:MAG: Fe-S assembly protein IscX [Planctomycetaceae bacterium]
MATLKWADADEIGFELSEKYPDIDPLSMRFVDLHRYVTELAGFGDSPGGSTESALENIQMAWLGYYKENQ